MSSEKKEKDLNAALGIDIGTASSCVSIFRHGVVELFANEQGNRVSPSLISFDSESGDANIGESAEKDILSGKAIQYFHSLVGLKYNEIDLNRFSGKAFSIVNRSEVPKEDRDKPFLQLAIQDKQKFFTSEDLLTLLYSNSIRSASQFHGLNVTAGVITVPNRLSEAMKKGHLDAAQKAGVRVLRVLNSATAAAIAYDLDKPQAPDTNVLVFDLSNQYAMATVLSIDAGIIQTLGCDWSKDGVCAGDIFDDRLCNYLLSEFIRKQGSKGAQIQIAPNSRAMKRLRLAAEKAKNILSTSNQAPIEVDSMYEGQDFLTNITRARFEGLIADLFPLLTQVIDNALLKSNLKATDIKKLIFVGASTKIPKVREIVQAYLPSALLLNSIDSEEVVAYGAAVQASILVAEKRKLIDQILLQDVTSASIGIEVSNGLFAPLLNKNSKLPATVTVQSTTSQDNQTSIFISLYEGENPVARLNRLLGRFELSSIPPAPAGVPRIEILLSLDVDGLLNLAATDTQSGVTTELTITGDKPRAQPMPSPSPSPSPSPLPSESNNSFQLSNKTRDLLLKCYSFVGRSQAILSYAQNPNATEDGEIRSVPAEEKNLAEATINKANKWLSTIEKDLSQIGNSTVTGSSAGSDYESESTFSVSIASACESIIKELERIETKYIQYLGRYVMAVAEGSAKLGRESNSNTSNITTSDTGADDVD